MIIIKPVPINLIIYFANMTDSDQKLKGNEPRPLYTHVYLQAIGKFGIQFKH